MKRLDISLGVPLALFGIAGLVTWVGASPPSSAQDPFRSNSVPASYQLASCPQGIVDQAAPGECILASSDPIDGAFLPNGQGVFVDPSKRVGVGTKTPSSSFEIQGGFTEPLSGTMTVPLGGVRVLGLNTQFLTELVEGEGFRIGSEVFEVDLIQSDTLLTVAAAATENHFSEQGFRLDELLTIRDGSGEVALQVDRAGKLDVAGPIQGFGIVPIGAIIPWHKSKAGTPALPEGWVECNGQLIADGESPYDGQTAPNLNGEGRFLRGSSVSGVTQADTIASHTASSSSVAGTIGGSDGAHTHSISGTVGGSDGGHTHGINDPGHSHTIKHFAYPQEQDYGYDHHFSMNGSTAPSGVSTTGVSVNSSGSGHGHGFSLNATTSGSGHGHGFALNAAGQTYSGASETRPVNMSVVWILRIK